MKRFICLCALLMATTTAFAHPGSGIVMDSRGNIFFTDLKQVWKITPEGKKTVAVPKVHTHQLGIDGADNLYGEHLWYEGEATNIWRHRVWCLQRDGKLVDLIPAREGFLNDFSFVRDGADNLYWSDFGSNTVIKKRTPDGMISTYLTYPFRAIGSLTALPDGTLYLMEEGKLRRISTTGEITTIAERVTSQRASSDKTRDPHYYFGMWTDGTGAAYICVTDERMVVKVTPMGELQNIIASPDGWGPTGGLFDRHGELWLLETSVTNNVRVRHVSRNGAERIF